MFNFDKITNTMFEKSKCGKKVQSDEPLKNLKENLVITRPEL
jgi:hypothetical protein